MSDLVPKAMDSLRDIQNFDGNINELFFFLQDLFYFNQTEIKEYLTSKKKLTTYLNNLIRLGVVDTPDKLGRSNIYNGKSVLQLLTAAKYMRGGATMRSLIDHFKNLDENSLIKKLETNRLTDIKAVKENYKKSMEQKRKAVNTIDDLYHHVRISRGIVLQVKYGEYELNEVEEMRKLLQNYISK